jgi:hypothetical protein
MTRQSEGSPLDQDPVDELLARFLRDDLTLHETEEAIRQLHQAGHDVVSPLLAMLEDPRPEQNTIASVLITATGDAEIAARLVERIHDPAVGDVVKVKLITAAVELDHMLDAEDLLAHLADAREAVAQTRQEHLELLESPGDVALWMENVQAEMTPHVRLHLVENSVMMGNPRSVPMLVCLCYDPDEVVALAAIDAVERFKDARALRPLEELAAHHPSEDVREEAGKTVARLRVRASLADQPSLAPIPPLHAAYLTPVDGRGAQVAFVVRGRDDGTFTAISVLFDDQEGIQHCNGADLERDELEEMLREYNQQGTGPVLVSHVQCLEALDQAMETSWTTGHGLPMSYLAWRDWIERDRPAAPSGEPPGLVVPPGRRDELLAQCDGLLLQDEFHFWLFPPAQIEDLRSRYVAAASEVGGGLDRETLRCLLGAGLRQLVTERQRDLIAGRLRRMVPLLREIYLDEVVWQWAAVAAEALDEASGLPLDEHPFLLGMLAGSLENAIGAPVGWFGDS